MPPAAKRFWLLLLLALGFLSSVPAALAQWRKTITCPPGITSVMSISEVHYKGLVVVGIPDSGVTIKAGQEMVVFGSSTCHRTTVESIQLNGKSVQDVIADGVMEVGLGLTKRVRPGCEMRRLEVPSGTPAETQLQFDDVIPSNLDVADTDVAEPADLEMSETDPNDPTQG